MALDTTALNAYINETSDLISKIILEDDLSQITTVQDGIKSAEAINIFSINSIAQAGGGCAFNPLGSVPLTQRIVTVCPIAIQDNMCLSDLEAYYTQSKVNNGSYLDKFGFEDLFLSQLMKTAKQKRDALYFFGDVTSPDPELALCDGLFAILDADISVIDGNTSGAIAITPTNIIGLINDMIAATPQDVKTLDTVNLVVGFDVYDMYIQALIASNLYHIDATNVSDNAYKIPGSRITLKAMTALNGSNRMVVLAKDLTVLGTDLESDLVNFNTWNTLGTNEFNWNILFKVGAQVAFPEMVVTFNV